MLDIGLCYIQQVLSGQGGRLASGGSLLVAAAWILAYRSCNTDVLCLQASRCGRQSMSALGGSEFFVRYLRWGLCLAVCFRPSLPSLGEPD